MQTVPQVRKHENQIRRGNPDRAEKVAQLRSQIDASLETLAQAVDAVRASEEFTRYLNVQAKFHQYSWHNAMLILSQRPSAEQSAGYAPGY